LIGFPSDIAKINSLPEVVVELLDERGARKCIDDNPFANRDDLVADLERS